MITKQSIGDVFIWLFDKKYISVTFAHEFAAAVCFERKMLAFEQ